MKNFLDRIANLSPKQLTVLAARLQERVESLEQEKAEPIAIVGMGCRFPGGVRDPESYWRLLQNGVDAITEVPASRWDVDQYYDADPDAPGKIATRFGGFIDDVDLFDPVFFGISPREARGMDPQQRILLEVCWEALEHAAISPDKLRGTSTGVFLGIAAGDYFHIQLEASGEKGIDAYLASGTAHSIASGRISYFLGLQGPSISVDTACSSSLVAAHLAIQSLRTGECQMALVGGVNLLLSPETSITLSKAHMLSPHGRCKTFAADADGYVRGEGCGVVVLKRLSQAQQDGDTILAVIEGTAMNQDGRSNGLTAPNGPAQEAVIRAALGNAGLEPEMVAYVETHGTGTSLGDPIEVQALGAVLARSRKTPLLLGSVKTNIGHLEASAGIASLIKVAMAVNQGVVPPHLHLQERNPYIPWDKFPALTIPQTMTEISEVNGRYRAGVSSFGFSGTNVHMIVASPPEPADAPHKAAAPAHSLHLVTLSAKDKPALRQLAAQMGASLKQQPVAVADLAFTTTTGRAHHEHRLAVLAARTEQVQEALATWLAERSSTQTAASAVMEGVVSSTRAPRIAFLFTGQGAQYAGMVRELYESQPTFRRELQKCDELLRPYLERPLLEVLYAADEATTALVNETAYTQPALFAVEYALARLWQSWGVTPSAVMGHSVGEYVAACVAGLFSLEDGLKLIAARGRLMQALPAGGVMAAVFATEADVRAVITPYASQVSIAAINGPDNVVVSGAGDAVTALLDQLSAQGIKSRRLTVSHAFHSPLMEPILDEFTQMAQTVSFQPLNVGLISNVTGRQANFDEIGRADYWRQHVRQPVRFADAMHTLAADGYEIFLEIGPSPTLISMGQRCFAETTATWLPSLRPGTGDWEQMFTSLAKLYLQGVAVNWEGVTQDDGPYQKLILPRYPFQRESYWVETQAKRPLWTSYTSGDTARFPLLGQKLSIAGVAQTIFETAVGPARYPFLLDHRIYGTLVLPSPVYMEMALAAAAELWGDHPVNLMDVVVHQALQLPDEDGSRLQCIVTPVDDATATCAIYSHTGEQWQRHMSATLSLAAQEEGLPESERTAAIKERCQETTDVPHFYHVLTTLGLQFGPCFQGVESISRIDGECLARMALPVALENEIRAYRCIHPALLDTCFHMVGAALPEIDNLTEAFLLLSVDEIAFYETLPARFWTHVRLDDGAKASALHETFSAHMWLIADDGKTLAEFKGLHFKRARPETLLPTKRDVLDEIMFEIEWPEQPLPVATAVTLLPPVTIEQALQPHLQAVFIDNDLALYDEFQIELDALCRDYIVFTLAKMGFALTSGTQFGAVSLATRLGVISRHRRLFARMLEILVEDGILQKEDEWFRVIRLPEQSDPPARWAELLAQYPPFDAELNLTGRCAGEMVGVLRGQVDPLQLLFPGGSLAETERLYQYSPAARAYNTLVKEAVMAALTAVPAHNKIRILEIGAGTGGTSSYVLPHLPAERTEYVFTDVSPLFTTRAQEKFVDYPFIEYRVLDIANDPLAQGYEPYEFDIVLASNVLHATSNLLQTLAHVRQLIAPQGLLVLLEGTAPQRFGDLTVGYTEGWWAFDDTDLRDYALISREKWAKVLAQAGFSGVTAVPGADSKGIFSQQAIMLAQAQPAATEPGDWLIFADTLGVGQQLAASLAERQQRCVLVTAAAHYTNGGGDTFQLAPAREEDFDRLLRETAPQHAASWRGVVYLWAMDSVLPEDASVAELMAGQQTVTGGALALAKALITRQSTDNLWLVTQGAQAAIAPGETAPPVAAAPATLWGLSHVIALEYPDLHCRRVDLDMEITAVQNHDLLLAEIWSTTLKDDQVAFRQKQRRVRRLTAGRRFPFAGKLAFSADGAYLLTGGLGGLGLPVAEWLVNHGARNLVLLGRNAPSETAQALIADLESTGATVKVVHGNVASEADLSKIFAMIDQEMPPLRGVFHMAGVLDDGVLLQQKWPRFETVMQSKVVGSWLLDQMTRKLSLDHFVLFSSGASLLGSPGQSNHAAANAFMDALAFSRQSQGLPAVSINWGAWDTGAATKGSVTERKDIAGFSTQNGLRALTEILAGEIEKRFYTQVGVVALNWQQLPESMATSGLLHNFQNRIRQEIRPSFRQQSTAVTAEKPFTQQLNEAPANRRKALLLNHLRQHAANVLGISQVEDINVRQPLQDLGLDSLMAVELRNVLVDTVGRPLPATLLFEYPTIVELTDFLADMLLESSTALSESSPVIPQKEVESGVDFDALSEDEMAALLLEKLEELD